MRGRAAKETAIVGAEARRLTSVFFRHFFFSIPEKRDRNRSTGENTNLNFRNTKINAEKKERKIIIITVREKDER